MGRPPEYSPEEDAIILRTSGRSHDETNVLLKEAGFETRSRNQIFSRRKYLRQRNPTAALLTDAVESMTLEELLDRRGTLEEALVVTRSALADVARELKGRLKELQEDVDDRLLELSGVLDGDESG